MLCGLEGRTLLRGGVAEGGWCEATGEMQRRWGDIYIGLTGHDCARTGGESMCRFVRACRAVGWLASDCARPEHGSRRQPPLISASDGITIPAGLIFPLHPLSDAQHFGPSGSRPPRLPGRPRHPLAPTDSPTSPTRGARSRPQLAAASSSIDNEQGSQPTSPHHTTPRHFRAACTE